MLAQLLYVSQHDGLIDDLPSFVSQMRDKNKKMEISSILLSTEKCYLHLLEGRRKDINNLYNKITKDERHHNCMIIRYIDIKAREFAEWNSEHMSINEFRVGDLNLLIPDGDFEAESISSAKAVTIIRRIHAHLRVRYLNLA